MPVVIHEFEVVAEPPPAVRPSSGRDAEPATQPPAWTVRDLVEILERERQRAARIRPD